MSSRGGDKADGRRPNDKASNKPDGKPDGKPDADTVQPPKPPHWFATLRAEPPLLVRYGLAIAGILTVLILWQWVGGKPGSARALIMPEPGTVFGWYDKLEEQHLYDHIWVSVRRLLIGFSMATMVGVGLGILGASFRAVGHFLSPLITFMRSAPMGAVVPLTIVWFGIDETQKQMFIFLASVPFILSDTTKAMAAVPQRYVETAQTLGASRWQIISKVLVPLSLPDIITSLRIMFGLALGYIMLAEAINPKAGLGFLLNAAQVRGSGPEPIYLILIVIGILAFLFDFAVRFFQRGMFPYRNDL